MDSLGKRGYNISEVKNYWLKDLSYKGVNTNLLTPDGYEFELQFHSPHNLEVKEEMHKYYEEQRVLDPEKDRAKYIELQNQMDEIKKKNKVPKDIEKIKEV